MELEHDGTKPKLPDGLVPSEAKVPQLRGLPASLIHQTGQARRGLAAEDREVDRGQACFLAGNLWLRWDKPIGGQPR